MQIAVLCDLVMQNGVLVFLIALKACHDGSHSELPEKESLNQKVGEEYDLLRYIKFEDTLDVVYSKFSDH
jgi:hypothetical protein